MGENYSVIFYNKINEGASTFYVIIENMMYFVRLKGVWILDE